MSLTAICEGQSSSTEVPGISMIHEVTFNHRFDSAVELFCLPIGLLVIGLGERILNVQYLAQALAKLSGEASTIVS